MNFYAEKFVIFLLVFIRTASMFATAPLYGNQAIPGQLKIWAAAFFAFAIFPLIASANPTISLDLGSLIILGIQEAIVGSAIGFSLGIIFHGVVYAGDLFGIVMGFSISSVIDRQNGFNVPVIGQFEYIVAIFIFLILDGHLFLVEALKMSYTAVPVSGLKISEGVVSTFVHLTGMVFLTAIKVGAPVIVSLFLTDVLMGIISRMVPQLNVFFVGMPLKAGIGLFTIMASLPFFVFVFGKLLGAFERDVIEMVRLM
ncbi:MAG TPA: flagellar biosynthetic protein FliR [Candidatus Acidoferrales bacterium]|nr:flagellar biosynthetic protein FliR [Candidatus Acidoferrales bacterium]